MSDRAERPGRSPFPGDRDTFSGCVVVRCDAGPAVGIGHVMRCIALSEELAERGLRVVFVADLAEVTWARTQVETRGFAHVAPPASTAHEARFAAEFDPVLVVIDSYLLPEAVYVQMREIALTLALVDGSPQGRPADVWLDQNIGAEDDEWLVPSGTARLAGLTYALMRSDIRTLRDPALAPLSPTSGPARVFLVFGGTDAQGAGEVLLPAVLATDRPLHVRIVAPTPEIRASLEALPAGRQQLVEVIDPTDELASEVVAADLVVGAAGTSMWEMLCLGAACLLVCVADNQARAYERVVGLGVVAGVGTLSQVRADQEHAVRTLALVLDSPEERDRLRRAGHALVDGRGRERVVDTLLQRLARA